MKLPFYKYHGAGNDFIIMDSSKREQVLELKSEDVQKMCERRFGIGADGLMILAPSGEADFEMVYFNSDGRTSTMCGNGGRCIVQLASELAIFNGKECSFKANDGIHRAKILANGVVSLAMKDVSEVISANDAYILDTGSPHYVKYCKSLSDLDVVEEGKSIRNSGPFRENGINVNFVKQIGEKLIIRTYERGVEDETLACGTGVTAAAIIHCFRFGDEGHQEVQVEARGGSLMVAMKKNDGVFTDVWLTGPTQRVFTGEIEIQTSQF